MELANVKMFSESFTVDMEKYDLDSDVFAGEMLEFVDKVKDSENIGEVKFKIDYAEIPDEDFFGNNIYWPMKVVIISTNKDSADDLVKKILDKI